MAKNRGFWGWGWLALFGCGQELVLPMGAGDREPEPEATADHGETGTAGAPAAGEPHGRLPLPEGPSYTTFGGSGGEAPAEQGGADPSSEPATTGGKSNAGTGGTMIAPPAAEAGAGGGASPDITLPEPELLFSEYVEGSGSFKALEIVSLNAASLEGCELRTHSNGKVEPIRLALHGSVEAGGLHVLCSSALATSEPARCHRSTNLIFNGDDALALACGGRILDVFGQIGVDPGEAWGAGATADHTLRRRCEVAVGREDGSQPFEPAAEWETLATDVFDDLGQRSCP